MEKPAETTHAIHDLLRRRWSPRAFANQAVEPETLGSLVEAARWAPSCFNEQPWSFLVATKDNDSEHRRMLECIVEGNVGWAQYAPVLMISVAKLAFDHNGKPNTHAWHDVGLAVGNMLVQATSLGLGAHQMAGFYPEKAKEGLWNPGWTRTGRGHCARLSWELTESAGRASTTRTWSAISKGHE